MVWTGSVSRGEVRQKLGLDNLSENPSVALGDTKPEYARFMILILLSVSFVGENTLELEVSKQVSSHCKIKCGEIFTALAKLRVKEIVVLP